jgi:membrane fusion protein, heavy metal efflux system
MKSNLLLLRLILLLTILLSCKKGDNTTDSLSPVSDSPGDSLSFLTITREQFETAGMAFGGFKPYTYAESVTANGYIDVPPQNKVRIGTFMGGYVKSSELLPGEHVQKGQVLIVLENIEYLKLQQDYLEAREQLEYLKSVYDSQAALAEEKISSQRNYLQAKSDYNRMLAVCESLAKQLQLIRIDPAGVKAETMESSISLTSPLDGYVTEVNVVKGMFVNPSDILCEIINPDHLHIELKVFEKDIFKLRKGQLIVFRIPDVPGVSGTGEIILFGKSIDGDERTVEVHGHITGKPVQNLTPGMYIEAVIQTETTQVEGLPIEALVTDEGKNFVFIRKSEQQGKYLLEKVPVELGRIHEKWFEVIDTQGYLHHEGDNILVKGSYFLSGE